MKILLLSDNIEALACENVLPDSVHGLGPSLGSDENIDFLEVRDGANEFL